MAKNHNGEVLTLDNGLRLVMQRGAGGVTAFAICSLVGARNDPADKLGLANLIAETLPTGTAQHSNRWLTERFDFLGVHRHCSASIETTNFGATFLPQHLGEVVKLIAEIFLHPKFPTKELDTARDCALQELQAIEDEPRQKIFRILNEAYLGPTLGREVLGNRETLPKITRNDAVTQHAASFAPANTIIAVGGKFDPKKIHRVIERNFGKWNRSQGRGEPLACPQDDRTREPRVPTSCLIHHPKESDQEQIALAFPSVSRTDSDYFTVRVIAAILSGGMSSRLFTEVREKRGLVYAVSAWHSYMRGFGYFAAYAGTTAVRSQETLDVLCAELKRAGENITDDELSQTKIGLKSKLIIRSEQPAAQASRVLNDLIYVGHLQPLDEVADAIDRVDRASIERFAAKYPPRPMTIATLGPKELVAPKL